MFDGSNDTVIRLGCGRRSLPETWTTFSICFSLVCGRLLLPETWTAFSTCYTAGQLAILLWLEYNTIALLNIEYDQQSGRKTHVTRKPGQWGPSITTCHFSCFVLHSVSVRDLLCAQNGKDMRHLAASLTFHDIVTVIDQKRFSIVSRVLFANVCASSSS